MWSWGRLSHEEALQQGQIADSQRIFPSAFINNAVNILSGGITFRYQYGTHEAAIMQQQIASSSLFIESSGNFPQTPILGLKRDFPITQEEQPQDAPSYFRLRTAYLPSVAPVTPVVRPVIPIPPQYPLDQLGTIMFAPAPAAAVLPPPPAAVIQFLESFQQEFAQLEWNSSDVVQPFGQTGPISISLVPPTILGLEDPGVDPTTLLGSAFLRWSSVPGASAYRVYINGVPQNPPIMGQSFQATGLVVGQQYIFGVVAVAAGIDDSPMSNEIYYEHGTNEFSVTYKYPWGNTPETGYVLVVKLGTPV